MILTIGGIKGGSGKSTLATHLAVAFAGRGKRVLLMDTDEQATSYDFTQLRIERLGDAGYTCTKQHGRHVGKAIETFGATFDAVLVDTGGRDSVAQRAALLKSDLVAIPFVPLPFDTWTLDPINALLEEIRQINPRLAAVSYINRAARPGPLMQATIDMLGGSETLAYSGLHLGSRIAFGAASADGLTVAEAKPSDRNAVREVEQLAGYLYDRADRAARPTLT